MSEIENIKKLRQSTGAGFKDCNAALKESNGDLEKAAEILRVKGIAKASKKMSRNAKEGVIVVSKDDEKTSLIEINCETDFVAKNEDFINFAKELSDLNNKCSSDIDKLNQSLMKNNIKVADNLVSLIAKVGEKITVGRTKTFNHEHLRNFVYQHSIIKDNVSKLAVIILLESKDKSDKIDVFGKQLSMHIAASNPSSISIDRIPEEIIMKEEALISQELQESGKPADIVKKISFGKIKKFKEEISLMTQDWVMEPKKKVHHIIEDLGLGKDIIKDFVRYKIGE